MAESPMPASATTPAAPPSPPPTVGRRLKEGMRWTLFGNLAFKILAAFSAVVVARLLGPEGMGEYGIVMSTVSMIAVYGAFRLGNTAIKYVAEYRSSDPVKAARVLRLALSISLVSCGIAGAAIVFFAPWIATHLLQRPDVSGSLVIGGVLLLFLTYGNIAQQALAGFEDFRSIGVLTAVRGGLNLILCVPLAYYWGAKGALIGLVIASVTLVPCILHRLRRDALAAGLPVRVPLRQAWQESPVLWQFALPGFLMLGLSTFAQWFGRVTLTRLPDGLAHVGLFEAAGQWTSAMFFLPSALARVVLPILAERSGQEHSKGFGDAFHLQLQAVLMVTAPLALGVIALSDPIAFLYGERYVGIDALLPILTLAAFFRAINETSRVAYEGKGRQWQNLTLNLAWGAIFILGILLLVPRWRHTGLALAALAAEGFLFGATLFYVNRQMVPGVLRRHAPMATASVALLLVSWFAQAQWPIAVSAPVSVVLILLGALPLGRRVWGMRFRGLPVSAHFRRLVLRSPAPTQSA